MIGSGCGGSPKFPELHHVSGVVKNGKRFVTQGTVHLIPASGSAQFEISSPISQDGTFTFTTMVPGDGSRTQKPGVPSGDYQVMLKSASGSKQGPIAATQGYQWSKQVAIRGGETILYLDLSR